MHARPALDRLVLSTLAIPFKVAFRHASAEREATSSAWVEAHAHSTHLTHPPHPPYPPQIGYGESCPRPYVTGETLDSVRAFVARHQAALLAEIVDLTALEHWVSKQRTEIDRNPAAWCAIELAILDLFAKQRQQTVEALLSLPPLNGRFTYTAVVGDSEDEVFRTMVKRYLAQGFTDFKLKLSGDRAKDRAKLATFASLDSKAVRVRVDANNLWATSDQAIPFLRDLGAQFVGVEEPIGADQYERLLEIAAALNCRVILDESFLRVDQLSQLPGAPDRWLINLRVSKMGGILRSLAIVDAARHAGIGIIIGAQVGETSLLTRAGLAIANMSRDILVGQEGAFGTHLLQRDICDPPLMFGAAGVLDVQDFPQLQAPGWGFDAPLAP